MNETGLHEVLSRATDALERPHLAASALADARTRRTRRRGAAAAGAAALAVVATVVGIQLVDAGGSETEPAPAPAPTPSGPRGGEVADEMVHQPLAVPSDLPQDDSLTLPDQLVPTGEAEVGPFGSAVAAVQTSGGAVSLLSGDGSWLWGPQVPTGSLFRHSLALDGGAVAVRTDDGFDIYSTFADKAFSYPLKAPGGSGLWANDSVAFAYDVPGPGAEMREHENPFSTDAVAFPEGDDLDNIDLHGDGTLHEFVDGDYLQWTNFQDKRTRWDMTHLGRLRGPVTGYGGEDVVAVVRSELESESATDADGVLVLDHDAQPLALLPVEGVPIEQVQVHLWVDETRLLIEAGDALVLWETDTGALSKVSTIPAGATVAISDGNGSLVRR